MVQLNVGGRREHSVSCCRIEIRHVPLAVASACLPATPGHAVASEHRLALARPRCRATRFLTLIAPVGHGRAQPTAMLAKIRARSPLRTLTDVPGCPLPACGARTGRMNAGSESILSPRSHAVSRFRYRPATGHPLPFDPFRLPERRSNPDRAPRPQVPTGMSSAVRPARNRRCRLPGTPRISLDAALAVATLSAKRGLPSAAEAGSWMPATQSTFDMGVLVIGATRVGCLWVEDED